MAQLQTFPFAALLIVGFLSGCAQPSIPHTSPAPAATRSTDASSVLTRAELANAAQDGSLMAALHRLRPVFLNARGGTLLVSIDGAVFADTSVLHVISATDVCQVRLRRGTSGAGRSAILPDGGVSSGGDLIEISLRHGPATPC